MGRRGKEIGLNVLKNVIVEVLQSGYSRRKISEILKLPKSTVIDVRKTFSESGSFGNKPRSGRPPKSKPWDFRQLERTEGVLCPILRRNSMKGDKIRSVKERFSTIYTKIITGEVLQRRNLSLKKRLVWCRGKRQWTFDNWKRVIFLDESIIMIGHDERVRIWRRRMAARSCPINHASREV
jgi:transposase